MISGLLFGGTERTPGLMLLPHPSPHSLLSAAHGIVIWAIRFGVHIFTQTLEGSKESGCSVAFRCHPVAECTQLRSDHSLKLEYR